MKPKLLIVPLLILAVSLAAQTPVTDPLVTDLINAGYDQDSATQVASTLELAAIKSKVAAVVISAIQNQQSVDEAKEAVDVANLQQQIAAIPQGPIGPQGPPGIPGPTGPVGPQGPPGPSTSLPVLGSVVISACDLSGVWNANPTNGPTQPAPNPNSAGATCKAGFLVAGERIYYTKYVPVPGLHNFDAQVASVSTTGTFHLEIGGSVISPKITVPNTTSWATYQATTPVSVNLPGGIVTVVFVVDSIGFDLLSLNFLNATASIRRVVK